MNAVLISSGKHVSMDAPLVEDEDSCLLDLFSNREDSDTDAQLVTESLATEIDRAISQLPDREAKIIKIVFWYPKSRTKFGRNWRKNET